MDISDYLKKYKPNKNKLKNFGFRCDNNHYILEKDLTNKDLYAKIEISDSQITARVIDKAFNDDFIPFNITNNNCKEKLEVENLIKDIINLCFDVENTTQKIIDFISKKYNTIPESPWEKYPNFYTFKNSKNKKWYAIIMQVKADKLNMDNHALVDIINVKMNPKNIDLIVDNKQYFYAYHMNKQNWITILLDKNTNMPKLKELIDDSYKIVDKSK